MRMIVHAILTCASQKQLHLYSSTYSLIHQIFDALVDFHTHYLNKLLLKIILFHICKLSTIISPFTLLHCWILFRTNPTDK